MKTERNSVIILGVLLLVLIITKTIMVLME